jgi:hypothetical protein
MRSPVAATEAAIDARQGADRWTAVSGQRMFSAARTDRWASRLGAREGSHASVRPRVTLRLPHVEDAEAPKTSPAARVVPRAWDPHHAPPVTPPLSRTDRDCRGWPRSAAPAPDRSPSPPESLWRWPGPCPPAPEDPGTFGASLLARPHAPNRRRRSARAAPAAPLPSPAARCGPPSLRGHLRQGGGARKERERRGARRQSSGGRV